MTRRHCAVVALTALALTSIGSVARAQTAAVSGVVMSDETPGRPVRRVTVSLVSADLRVPLSAVTDDDGQFTFAEVPAGNYAVVASKPAYVGAFYGSKRPGRGPGVPVAVREGQRVTRIVLTLLRGSVISGTLRLPSGRPAEGMPIVVTEIETVGGDRRLRLTGGRGVTDDRGAFRVYGLPPGEYVVQAQPSGLLFGAQTGVNDARATTAAEVSWAQQAARFRAGETTPGAPPPAPAAPDRGPTMNYATVFFPGTADPSAATPVTVGRGEERGGVDFALALVSTARITGVIFGPDDKPLPNAQISLAAKEDALNVVRLLTPRAAVKSAADGSFALPAVAPGHYQLVARSAPTSTGSSVLWAQQDLDVAGQDVSNLVLALQPGMTVSGKVVFDASVLPMPTPDDLARARVTLVPVLTGSVATDAVASGATSVTANVAADGTFALAGLVPRAYRVTFAMPGLRTNPSAPNDGWSLRSVMRGDVDLADRALEIRPRENVDGLVARFTDRPTELSGVLTDQANRAAPGYPIVVFSTNRNDWTAGSRRVTAARPSTDGTFRVVGLPAGTYLLCAVVDLDQADLDDPAFLEQLAPVALTITLTDGAKTVQNLKLAGGK